MLVDGVTLDVAPLAAKASYKAKAYQALRDAIVRMNIYGHSRPIRIDEAAVRGAGHQPDPGARGHRIA